MALIRIVESADLRPELSLRASDYFEKDNMNVLAQQRLETGRPTLTQGDVDQLTKAPLVIPSVAEGQLWETMDSRDGGRRTPKTRRVKVIRVGATHASVKNLETGHITKVRLAAFRGRTKKDYYPVANGS